MIGTLAALVLFVLIAVGLLLYAREEFKASLAKDRLDREAAADVAEAELTSAARGVVLETLRQHKIVRISSDCKVARLDDGDVALHGHGLDNENRLHEFYAIYSTGQFQERRQWHLKRLTFDGKEMLIYHH